jgi:hypothetical protein
MKAIVSHIILMLLPVVLFIISFYLVAATLSKEREVSDISSKVLNFVNEAEILKTVAIERLKSEKKDFVLEGKYCRINAKILNLNENEMEYEISAKPKEDMEVKISLFTIGKIKI